MAGTPNGGTRTFQWNLRLTSGLAYPAAGVITQRAQTKPQAKTALDVPQQYIKSASAAGGDFTLTDQDDGTTVFSAVGLLSLIHI